jgi:hypothetical protein
MLVPTWVRSGDKEDLTMGERYEGKLVQNVALNREARRLECHSAKMDLLRFTARYEHCSEPMPTWPPALAGRSTSDRNRARREQFDDLLRLLTHLTTFNFSVNSSGGGPRVLGSGAHLSALLPAVYCGSPSGTFVE